MLLSRCRNVSQIYALRFLVGKAGRDPRSKQPDLMMCVLTGLAESTFYPGMQYIIGSWYRRDELAKRSCIFHTSGAIATMFSGYLMAAVYHLGGTGGLAGWRWYVLSLLQFMLSVASNSHRLFIMDGVISMPIALAGYYFIPDTPETTRATYLTEDVRPRCSLFKK